MRNLVDELRKTAAQIAKAGHAGWGNTMSDAADELAAKDAALAAARDLVVRWMQGAKDMVVHYPADSAKKLMLIDCARDLAVVLPANGSEK